MGQKPTSRPPTSRAVRWRRPASPKARGTSRPSGVIKSRSAERYEKSSAKAPAGDSDWLKQQVVRMAVVTKDRRVLGDLVTQLWILLQF